MKVKINCDMKSKYSLYYFSLLLSVIFMFKSQDLEAQNTSWYYQNLQAESYDIGSLEDYKGFVELINNKVTDFKGKTINITSNLDFSSYNVTTNINCRVNGNGHTIRNRRSPLFNEIQTDGLVENLVFDQTCGVSNQVNAGMVSVYNRGTIRYVETSADISANIYDDYCHIGGICGYNYGKIIGCTNKGSITVTQPSYYKTVQRVAGISAYNEKAVVAGCTNEGNVTLTVKYYGVGGGIAADLQDSEVISCINRGDVKVKLADSSGISSNDIILYAGGITGQAQVGSTIDQCANYGAVQSNAQYVGGIAGQVSHTSLSNLINYGEITSLEASYYSCAAGITGYSHNINYSRPFLNCVNFGKVSSNAKGAIATASGITMEITQATVANLKNFGSVSANSYGSTLSAEFVIDDYETEKCNVLNEPSSIGEMQSFVNSNPIVEDIYLCNWIDNGNGDLALSNNIQVFVDPFFTKATFYIISDNPNVSSALVLKDSASQVAANLNRNESRFDVAGLKANEQYNYELTIGDRKITGYFTTITPKVSFDALPKDFFNISCNISADCNKDEIENYGVYYKKNVVDEYQWQKLEREEEEILLENLVDNVEYVLRPYVKVTGTEFFGETIYSKTNAIPFDIELNNIGLHSIDFICENYENIKQFKPSVEVSGNLYYANDSGIISIGGLEYNTSYVFLPKLETPHGVNEYPTLTYSTSNNGTDRCYQLSSTAAMLTGLASFYGTVPSENRNAIFNRVMFEYRDIDGPLDQESSFIEATMIDKVDKLFAVTLPFPQNATYQYRMIVDNGGTSFSYYYSRKGDWMVAAKENAIHIKNIVEPWFYSIVKEENTVSSNFIAGEEPIVTTEIELGRVNSDNFNIIPGSSFSLENLVANEDYKGRFVIKTAQNTYYSDYFLLDKNRNLTVIAGDNDEDTPLEPSSSLTILCPNDGIITVKESTEFELTLPAALRFNAIYLNGMDITDYSDGKSLRLNNLYGDNELTYTIELIDESAVASIHEENIKVYTTHGKIHVINASMNMSSQVYGLNGMKIYDGTDKDIDVASGNIYILKIDNRSFKVFVP